MGGNRTLIIVALVLIVLVAIVGGGYWYMTNMRTPPTPEVEETPEPVNYTEIVVAIQNIPRGMSIRAEDYAMELQPWPNDYLPVEYYTDLTEVEGKFARMDIPRGMPVLPSMVSAPGGMLAAEGSAAALFGPPDRVAYAIPMDLQGAVAWAIKPGDRVDVVAAIGLTAVDPEFQSLLPNNFFGLPQSEDQGTLSGIYGRFETLPNGQPALVYPTSPMIPNLVVQLTVQDAIVWHVGLWDIDNVLVGSAPPPPEDTGGGGEEGEGGGLLNAGAEEPTPVAPAVIEFDEVAPVTLLVKREDVLVLKYLHEMGADLDLVLRPAGFSDTVLQTQPVWLRYIVDKYQLPETPPDLPVAPLPVRDPIEIVIETPEPAQE